MKLKIVAGARPNFMKIAPIIHAIKKKQDGGFNIQYRLVHTGQHYDKNLSDTFFEDLNIPAPDINFEVKSSTQSEQTAAIMIAFEAELKQYPCDLVLVVGDVTSTMACAIVAKKESVKLAHVEGGIRSGDLSMPEEINRIVTDSLSDYFFTTTKLANENLRKIGVNQDQIFFVGNVMIDTLRSNENRLKQPQLWSELKLSPKNYIVMTLHRPSNVDEAKQLGNLLSKITELGENVPVIFPIHPRTKIALDSLDLKFDSLHYTEPLGYLEFIYLIKHARGVITDSGGITEETTVMNVPCITLRKNTERPETCDIGTNVLVGNDHDLLAKTFSKMLKGEWKNGEIPELWDGKSAHRIVDHLVEIFDCQ